MWALPYQWNQPYRKTDLEDGARPLYPMMLESPQLRWAFIRKVYSILTLQLLVTIAVAAVVVSVRPIAVFFATTGAGLGLYILLILMPFIGMIFFIFSLLNSMVLVMICTRFFLIDVGIFVQFCVHYTTIIRGIR